MAWTGWRYIGAFLLIAIISRIESAQVDEDDIIFDPLQDVTYNTSSLLNNEPASASFSPIATGFINLITSKTLREIFTDPAFKTLLKQVSDPAGSPDVYAQEAVQKLGVGFAGIGALFIIGLILSVCVPCCGMIFCCCRCCDNCGGKRIQPEEDNTVCRRVSFAACLMLSTTFIFFGFAIAMLAVTSLSQSYNVFDSVVKSNLNDVQRYTGSLEMEINHILNEVVGVANIAVDELSNVAEPIVTKYKPQVNEVAEDLDQLQTNASSLLSNLKEIQQLVKKLDYNATHLEDELGRIKSDLDINLAKTDCQDDTNCETFSTTPGTAVLAMSIDFSTINVSTPIKTVEDLISRTLASKGDQVRELFDSIQDNVTALLEGLDEFNLDDLGIDELNLVKNLTSYFKDIEAFTNELNKVPADDVEQYSYAGGLVFCILIVIVAFAYLIGMCFGEFGRERDDIPHDRGTLANCGGWCLLLGWVFSFLIFFIITIFAAFLFLFGGIGEKFLCEPLSDTLIFDSVKDLLVQQDVLPEEAAVFADVSVSDALSHCENNTGVWKALQLDFILGDEIDSAFQEVRNQTNSIFTNLVPSNLNLSDSVNFDIGDQVQQPLKDIESSLDFTSFQNELSKNVTADLTAYANGLKTAVAGVAGPVKGDLEDNAQELIVLDTNTVKPMEQDINKLEAKLTEAEKNVNNIVAGVEDIVTAAEKLKTDIVQDLDDNLNELTQKRFPGFVDQSFDYVEKELKNNLGGCRPLFNLYRSIEFIVCDNLLDPLNTLWLGVGIGVLFFIFGIIFSVKLSKFYRRMLYEDSNGPKANGYDYEMNQKV